MGGEGWRQLTGLESDGDCFARGIEGAEASSISTSPSDSLLALMDLDADKMSTSVNCA